MNLVGKILTVFILVMSLVFMSFAVAVYATHKNWREVVMRPESGPGGQELGLMYQLKSEQDRYDDLKGKKDDLEARLTAEKDAAVQALSKLDTDFSLLEQENEQLQTRLDESDQERRKLLAQMKNTEARLAALRKVVEGDEDQGGKIPGLRKDVLQAQKERDQAVSDVIRLSDEKFQALVELKRLIENQQVLKQDLDDALAVLRKFELEPEPDRYRLQPPPVDGLVTAATSRGLVEVTIGSDDGLLKGHQLVVYRPSGALVGKIEVLKTGFDTSVCQVVPGTLQSAVQRNDLVTSRLLQLGLSTRSQNPVKPRPEG